MARILMTLESDFPHDERVEKEAKALIEGGHEVHILCYTKTHQTPYEIWNNIHIHRFQISKWIYKSSALCLQFPFYFNFWSKKLKTLLHKTTFDIIHIHDLPLVSVIEKLKAKYHFKTVLDLHENWPVLMNMGAFSSKFPVNLFFSFNQWKQYEKKWVQRVNGVITVIEEAKQRLVNFGTSKDKIIVASNTIDLESFQLPKIQKTLHDFSIIYSGGVNEHRGLHIVLQALKNLKDKGIKIHLVIVGGGNYMNTLKEMAKDLHLENQLIDLGWKSYQEMMEKIVSAQVLIIPHLRSEHTDATIPNKLFQYMYAQKPLLVSNCTPLKRIVEKENAGIVYEDRNADDLAVKIQDIYQDYEKYLASSIKNKLTVEERYHWGVEAGKLNLFYENIQKT
ncbi:MAG: glycosyltransferase [Bacteroidales bacterium]|nr:glycosyltransferase [Bacteroidales bacterium]